MVLFLRFQTQDSLAERVMGILTTANPLSKAKMAQSLARDWFDGHIETVGKVELPDDPARPPKPRLCMPRDVPKRKINRGVMGGKSIACPCPYRIECH